MAKTSDGPGTLSLRARSTYLWLVGQIFFFSDFF